MTHESISSPGHTAGALRHCAETDLPSDWEVSSVGAEFWIQLGKMLDASQDTGIYKPYIGNRAVRWGCIDINGIGSVPLTPSDLRRFRLKADDLLVCEGGEIGRSAIWNEPIPECYYQKALHRLRPRSTYSPYLMMSLLHLWTSSGYLDNYITRTSIAHLTKEKLELVPLPVPPLPEQRAITEALCDVDGLLWALEALVAKSQAIKRAAIQQLLTGKIRLSGFTGEWRTTSLGEVTQIVSGATPDTANPAYWNGTVPWCTPTDITNTRGKYLTATNRNITIAGLASCPASLLPIGALLLCTRATIGKVKIAAFEVCTNQGFKSLIARDRASNEFLYYLLDTLRPRLIRLATGSTFGEIGKHDITSIEVTLPPPREQRAIAGVLSDMDAEIATLERRLDKTRAVKQGMMQQLLTGRVRLVDPDVLEV